MLVIVVIGLLVSYVETPFVVREAASCQVAAIVALLDQALIVPRLVIQYYSVLLLMLLLLPWKVPIC